MTRSPQLLFATLATAWLASPAVGQARPYPFWPQGGNAGRDLAAAFYVDLDPGPGILDYLCGSRSYDTHGGVDATIRSFGEMDIADGVPVFAMLDGIVTKVREGNPDRDKGPEPVPNTVRIQHAPSWRTHYVHLRNGSVTAAGISVGSTVKAGQQIGSTGNAGRSSWPHLHFGSQRIVRGQWLNVEPFTGERVEMRHRDSRETIPGPATPHPPASGPWPAPRCNSSSMWSIEPPFDHGLRLVDLGVTQTDPAAFLPPPEPQPTGGWAPAGTKVLHVWATLVNASLSKPTRVRYRVTRGLDVAADETHDIAPPAEIGPMPIAAALDVHGLDAGQWAVTLDLDGVFAASAPLHVGPDPGNRAPWPPTAVSLDPATPTSVDRILFCRIDTPLINDPDHDIVRYRYLWSVDGVIVRTTQHAGEADAIPAGLAAGRIVRCEVTVTDGRGGSPGSFVAAATVAAVESPTSSRSTKLGSARSGIRGYPRLRALLLPHERNVLDRELSHGAPGRTVTWVFSAGRAAARPGEEMNLASSSPMAQPLLFHRGGVVDHRGGASLTLPLTLLAGNELTAQAWIADPTAADGLAASDAVVIPLR